LCSGSIQRAVPASRIVTARLCRQESFLAFEWGPKTNVLLNRFLRVCLAAFLLPVVCCPFQFTWIPLVDEKALPASGRTKIQYCAIVSDVHHSRRWRERLAAERALVRPRQCGTLPDLLGFALSFSERQYVTDSDWAFYVPSYDSTFVFPFEKSHSYLYHFTCDAGPPYYLRHLSRYGFLS